MPTDPAPRPEDFRASDADRDRTLDALHGALAEGRLTPEEHDERSRSALVARTLGQLQPLTSDLPHAEPLLVTGAERPVVAVFSSDERRGRFLVPRDLRAVAVFGSVVVDLTDAQPSAHETHLHCFAFFGTVEVLVPDGVDVRMDGVAVLGDRSMKKVRPASAPGAPVVHVHAQAVLGSVTVRPKRRPLSLQRRLRGRGAIGR